MKLGGNGNGESVQNKPIDRKRKEENMLRGKKVIRGPIRENGGGQKLYPLLSTQLYYIFRCDSDGDRSFLGTSHEKFRRRRDDSDFTSGRFPISMHV